MFVAEGIKNASVWVHVRRKEDAIACFCPSRQKLAIGLHVLYFCEVLAYIVEAR